MYIQNRTAYSLAVRSMQFNYKILSFLTLILQMVKIGNYFESKGKDANYERAYVRVFLRVHFDEIEEKFFTLEIYLSKSKICWPDDQILLNLFMVLCHQVS